jgi:hypothetical protein
MSQRPHPMRSRFRRPHVPGRSRRLSPCLAGVRRAAETGTIAGSSLGQQLLVNVEGDYRTVKHVWRRRTIRGLTYPLSSHQAVQQHRQPAQPHGDGQQLPAPSLVAHARRCRQQSQRRSTGPDWLYSLPWIECRCRPWIRHPNVSSVPQTANSRHIELRSATDSRSAISPSRSTARGAVSRRHAQEPGCCSRGRKTSSRRCP